MTLAELVEHARRFGPEGVLYTGYREGFNEEELLELATALDTLRCRDPKEKPLSQAKLARQVQQASEYIT